MFASTPDAAVVVTSQKRQSLMEILFVNNTASDLSEATFAPIPVLMSKRGHSETLVASHPGNANAVEHGVHSPRLIM